MEIKFSKVTSFPLYNLNFTVKDNKITGITGNGKTTILKLIDLLQDKTGKITYDDTVICPMNQLNIGKKISLVEEDFTEQIILSTVKEHLYFMIKYFKLTKENPDTLINIILEFLDIDKSVINKEIAYLSSSEKKLLQLAVALLKNPEVILLDEPFIDLDLKSEKKIIRKLKELKEKYHKTIVIASHDCDILYKYTDDLILLKDNTVLKSDTTVKLYKDTSYMLENGFDVPEIVLFSKKANSKNIKLNYHKDIRDLIKDVYKHV